MLRLATVSCKHLRNLDLFLLGDKVVNDRVEENSSNSDGASEQLDRIKRFSQDKSNTNDNNNTLSGVGNRLSDGTSLLESHGGELVVSVEPETGSQKVDPNSRGGLGNVDELAQTRSLLDEDDRDRHQESKNGGKSELVSNRSHTVLEARGLHELLVLVTLEGGEQVGNAGRNEGRDGKVKLLDGSKNDTSNDDWETHPLSPGDWLVVDELSEDGGKGWFGGLDDLSKGYGTGTHGKDGSTVSTHEAESNREHLDDVVLGDGRLSTGIRGNPHEKTVEHTNTELQGGDSHWETSLSTSSLQGKLVGDVVLRKREIVR